MMPQNEKKWFKPMFQGFREPPAKRSRTENEAKRPKRVPRISENWIEKFSPKSINELAVNAKKVQELQDWLTAHINTNRILLVTGPSGCGKTAAVTAVAQQMGVRLGEWITPTDIEHTKQYGSETFTYQEKQSDLFLEFLLKASRYPSLLSSQSSRIILVEDYPNTFLRNPSEFSQILQQYHDRGKSPLVFICSESFGDSTAWNLFPPEVQEKFKITQISLNPIANTNMKAAMKRIVTIMTKTFGSIYEIPNQETIEGIVNSSMGDIRSAINNLHFSSLKGEFSKLNTSMSLKKVVNTKNKKKEIKTKLNSMGKDENISIMHGVGRVLNPKLKEKIDSSSREEYTHSPDGIVEQFQTQPASFVSYIHENYLPHFANIDHVERAARYLSDSDCLMNDWKEKDGKLFGLSVAVGGLMTSNKSPVSSWHPIRGSKKIIVTYPSLNDMPLLDQNQLIKGKVLAADFKTYYEIIKLFTADVPDNAEIEDIIIE